MRVPLRAFHPLRQRSDRARNSRDFIGESSTLPRVGFVAADTRGGFASALCWRALRPLRLRFRSVLAGASALAALRSARSSFLRFDVRQPPACDVLGAYSGYPILAIRQREASIYSTRRFFLARRRLADIGRQPSDIGRQPSDIGRQPSDIGH